MRLPLRLVVRVRFVVLSIVEHRRQEQILATRMVEVVEQGRQRALGLRGDQDEVRVLVQLAVVGVPATE